MVLVLRRDEVASCLTGRKVDLSGALALAETTFRELSEYNRVVAYRDERTRLFYPPGADEAQAEKDFWIMPMYLPPIGCAAMRMGSGDDSMICLYDFEYMGLQALVQDQPLERLRRAIPGVLAAKHLRRPGPHSIGLVGNRGVMMAHEATDESQLRELSGMKRYHPPLTNQVMRGSSAIRPTFVELREAVQGHVVVHLIFEPGRMVPIEDAWISPGQLITTNDPSAIPEATLDRATLIYASRKHAPAWAAERGPVVELGDVLKGEHPGRTSADEIIVFISAPDLGFVDVATAWWCYQTARSRGLGVEVPLVDAAPVDAVSGL